MGVGNIGLATERCLAKLALKGPFKICLHRTIFSLVGLTDPINKLTAQKHAMQVSVQIQFKLRNFYTKIKYIYLLLSQERCWIHYLKGDIMFVAASTQHLQCKFMQSARADIWSLDETSRVATWILCKLSQSTCNIILLRVSSFRVFSSQNT